MALPLIPIVAGLGAVYLIRRRSKVATPELGQGVGLGSPVPGVGSGTIDPAKEPAPAARSLGSILGGLIVPAPPSPPPLFQGVGSIATGLLGVESDPAPNKVTPPVAPAYTTAPYVPTPQVLAPVRSTAEAPVVTVRTAPAPPPPSSTPTATSSTGTRSTFGVPPPPPPAPGTGAIRVAPALAGMIERKTV